MPVTEAAPYSSPFILDQMSENNDDLDFEFFNSNIVTPFEAAVSSPAAFLTDDFPFDSSISALPKQEVTASLSTLQAIPQALSSHSSTSPAGSFQDSSSDSSIYNRKTSSDSSNSAFTGKGDIMMTDTDIGGDWPMDDMMGSGGAAFGTYDGTVNPAAMNDSAFGFSDKSMENDFDFDSAASSPSPFAPGNGIGRNTAAVNMESPEMPTIKYETPQKHSPKLKSKFGQHTKANSVRTPFAIAIVESN
jgi:hypothetical protein